MIEHQDRYFWFEGQAPLFLDGQLQSQSELSWDVFAHWNSVNRNDCPELVMFRK